MLLLSTQRLTLVLLELGARREGNTPGIGLLHVVLGQQILHCTLLVQLDDALLAVALDGHTQEQASLAQIARLKHVHQQALGLQHRLQSDVLRLGVHVDQHVHPACTGVQEEQPGV